MLEFLTHHLHRERESEVHKDFILSGPLSQAHNHTKRDVIILTGSSATTSGQQQQQRQDHHHSGRRRSFHQNLRRRRHNDSLIDSDSLSLSHFFDNNV